MSKTPRKLFTETPWIHFSVAEGIFKTFVLLLLQIVTLLTTPVVTFLIVVGVGAVRLVTSFILVMRSRFELIPDRKRVLGSLLVGLVISYIVLSVLYLFSFTPVSLITIAALLISTYVLAEIYTKLSSGRIKGKQLFGVILALAAIVALIGGNEFDMTTRLVLVSLPLAAVINEFITRTMGTTASISAWVHNVWISISMLIFGIIGFVGFTTRVDSLPEVFRSMDNVWVTIVFIGLLIIASVFSRQKAFMAGGSFHSKRFVSMLTIFIMVAIVDFLLAPTVSVYFIGLGSSAVLLLSSYFVSVK